MWSALHNIKKRVPSLSLAVLFLFTQFAYGLVPFIDVPKVEAAPVCVSDTAGANDEPGQKDLTRLCEESAPAAGTEVVSWNWDDKGTSGGGQSLDACGLFDSDGDNFINFSICVTTQNDPAVIDKVTIYTCTADSKVDRCGGPNLITGSYATTCTVTQKSDANGDPFPTGDFSPLDTVASCNFVLSDLPAGTGSLALKDVCSYPSKEPNSDPSDCVIIQTNPVALIEVIKDVVPNGNPGLFNLTVDGPSTNDTTTVTDRGDGGTTGIISLSPPNNGGTAVVSETAGTGTSLANYSSSISCVTRSSGALVASGAGTSLQVPVSDGSNIVCTITNTAASSITIVKDAVPNHAQDFAFTATGAGTSNFSLDDDANATLPSTMTFNNLGAGTYTFTEAQVAGWYLDQIDCPNITETQNVANGTVSLTIAAGQNITCTFTNKLIGQIIVTKQTNPDNDPTLFNIAASPAAGVIGDPNRTIADNGSVTYSVKHSTYSVIETVPAGWTLTSNNCSNLVIDGNTPLVNGIPTLSCTIVNTKLAKLKILKDALPNGPQDFSFTTTGAGLTAFILDDDAVDTTYSNEQQFIDLTPNQTYTVTEGALTGWDLTSALCNKARELVGTTLSVALLPGEDITCTFTNTQRGSISGVKFNDLNGNGIFDQGEPVLSGWNIFIDTNGNGFLDNGELSALTNDQGLYTFSNLVPSNYTLAEVLLAGWTQTLAPAPVLLDPGETSTDNNFGNFQNGSVSGLKFNDRNGDGTRGQGEETLSGWTINLFNDGNDADSLLDDLVATTQTDVNGNYSFQNLTLGTYQVCEVQQAGWVQTFPANDGCHLIIIDQSGETNPSKDFGNQGRGSIRVLKNVDTDGDGQVDVTGATDWTWDIVDGAQNTATGSSQGVSAGTYGIHEDQKANFHFVSVSCDGGRQVPQGETTTVTVNPGDNVTCTYTNARDRGTLRLIKNVINNNGGTATAANFNLHVTQGGTDVIGSPAAGSASGTVYSLVTGTYNVSEDAPLAGYAQTGIVCGNQITNQANVTTNTEVVCTITNDDIAPQLTVIKQVVNDNSGTNVAADFTMHVNATNVAPSASFPGSEAGTTVTLNAGAYNVTEDMPVGSEYTGSFSADCVGTIALGQTKTCTVVNTDNPHPAINVIKNGPLTAYEGDTVTYTFTVTNTGDTATLSGITVNDTITGAATYQSGDVDVDGLLDKSETWIFTDTYTIPAGTVADVENTVTACGLDPDQTQVCDTDDHELDVLHPTITVIKEVIGGTEADLFDLLIDGVVKADDVSDGGTTGAVLVTPDIAHLISEAAGPNTSLDDFIMTLSDDCNGGSVTASGDANVTCTITNTRKATLTVVKDALPDDSQDFLFTLNRLQDEPEITDIEQDNIFAQIAVPVDQFSLDDDNDPTLERQKTITRLVPGEYTISEDAVAGWDLDLENTNCGEGLEIAKEGTTVTLTLLPGANVTCTFVNNKRPAALNITKTNNRPAPTTVGDTVTYTLTVSVPDDAGKVYGTSVQDLPPENFDYLPGSWTATSSVRGDIKADGITTEPTYGSPGAWKLGDMLPGEVVTLTYRALIANSVISGNYPDIAFTEGCNNAIGDCEVVLGNVSTGANSPFVRTAVAVTTPQVLGANTTILVETGQRLQQALVTTISLILLGLSALVVLRRKEGGRS